MTTIEQWDTLPEDEFYRTEVVRGMVVREPRPAPLHSRVQGRLIYLLEAHARAHPGTGAVLVEAEFLLALDPLTILVPDVAWVAAERIPPNGYDLPRWHVAPDLAVEVVSPRNRRSEFDERVHQYLAAGVRMVWIVDPATRSAVVHQHTGASAAVGRIAGGEVVPGFTVPVPELFPV